MSAGSGTNGRCPTCGEPIQIVNSGEGTSHYESVAAERIGELEAAMWEARSLADEWLLSIGDTSQITASNQLSELLRAALEPASPESKGDR